MNVLCWIFGHKKPSPYNWVTKKCRRCDFKYPGYCDHEWMREDHTVHETEYSSSSTNVVCDKCGLRQFATWTDQYPRTEKQIKTDERYDRMMELADKLIREEEENEHS
jgi:hypothetical protein